ncbi:hypothetical protein [Nocardioides sp. Soil805]|uniref:hypothetical protein n=1 Tax=Nocardioides sp. Soil805 TaxID=1736416 RepID=UPI00070329AF|nr:hypothetical protein [Nocardioides sp. Soil805]KRF34345.1 hypothetical protein ASG94_16735 [Nocardioides sp. Soil805]
MHTTVRWGLALAAVGVVLLPTAASATTQTLPDAAETPESRTDIVSTTVRHSGAEVVLRVHFDDLRRRNEAGLATYVDVDRARRGPEYVVNTGLNDGTDYQLAHVRRWQAVGAPLQCAHSVRLRWAKDVAVVRISRGCLEDPSAVRASVLMTDLYDGVHAVVDWAPATRRFGTWLAPS